MSMNKAGISLLVTSLITTLVAIVQPAAYASDGGHRSADQFTLSGQSIRISSQGKSAVFRLYDTVAAKQLYQQLPLQLELEDFRSAQWMFFPPEKLDAADSETYHRGKRGELSYYAPWGDVFMLHKDFYAHDHMHRLGVVVEGIDNIAPMSGTAVIERYTGN